MDITVLGATGGIGRAATIELLRRGHNLRAVSRSGGAVPGADIMRADLTDHDACARACADSDVVVMAAQPPYPLWASEWAPMLDGVIAGVAASGAKLVLVDNLYMYAPASGVLTENSPEHATDAKGVVRRQLGETLRAAHAEGRIRMTIGRFSDYYGPGSENSGLWETGIKPALAGKRPRGFVDLDQPHTFHFVEDAARGFATLAERDEADGHTWLLPAAPATTQRHLLELIAAELDTKSPGVITPWMFALGGLFDPMIRESRSVLPQYDRPWVIDSSAFTRTFGEIELTPHDVAVRATITAALTTDQNTPAPTQQRA